MSFENDFIIKMIRRIVQVLAQATGLIKEERFDEAQKLLDEELIDLTGLPEGTLQSANPDMITHLVTVQYHGEKFLAVADLFYHKGLILEGQKDPITAQKMYLIAHKILSQIVESEDLKPHEERFRSLGHKIAYKRGPGQ